MVNIHERWICPPYLTCHHCCVSAMVKWPAPATQLSVLSCPPCLIHLTTLTTSCFCPGCLTRRPFLCSTLLSCLRFPASPASASCSASPVPPSCQLHLASACYLSPAAPVNKTSKPNIQAPSMLHLNPQFWKLIYCKLWIETLLPNVFFNW